MAGTLIYAVRRAVIDGLSTHLAATSGFENIDLAVLWTPNLREQVFTTRATFTHQSASMRSGRTYRDERGRFDLVVLVAAVGEDGDYAADRAADIGLLAEEWIADHRSTLAVPGVNWLHVNGEGSMAELFGDSTTFCELVLPVEYNARLT